MRSPTRTPSTARPAGLRARRKPMAKRMRTKLREIKEQLMATRHDGIDGQGKWLTQVLRGWPTTLFRRAAPRFQDSGTGILLERPYGHNVMHDSLAMLCMIENHDIWRTFLDIADHAGLRIACRADAIANSLCSARIARDEQSARCLRIGQKFASPLWEPRRQRDGFAIAGPIPAGGTSREASLSEHLRVAQQGQIGEP